MSQLARYQGDPCVYPVEVLPSDPIALDWEKQQLYSQILQVIPAQFQSQAVLADVIKGLQENREAELVAIVREFAALSQAQQQAQPQAQPQTQYFVPQNHQTFAPVVMVNVDNSQAGSEGNPLFTVFLFGFFALALSFAVAGR